MGNGVAPLNFKNTHLREPQHIVNINMHIYQGLDMTQYQKDPLQTCWYVIYIYIWDYLGIFHVRTSATASVSPLKSAIAGEKEQSQPQWTMDVAICPSMFKKHCRAQISGGVAIHAKRR